MELRAKLQILADAAKYYASCASSGSKRATPKGGLGNSEGMGICHSYTPDGRCVSLLKILFTNVCIYDCVYCINRVSSSVKRARFSVAEVVWLTMEFYRRNYIEGLFLSSGVAQSSDATMEDMVEVARRLRIDEKFGGYIHLKAVAGASTALLAKAGLYAGRPWLEAEVKAIQPQVLVCMGVTAAQAIFGRAIKMRDERGRWQPSRYTSHTFITVHPAAVLRANGEAEQVAAFDQLVADLRMVAEFLQPSLALTSL